VAAADLPAEVIDAIDEGRRLVNGVLELRTERPIAVLNTLTGWALARDLELGGLEVRRPSLEDVYLELTE
jgi:hypothetical protein